MITFRKVRDGVIYALGVYTACGIAHNIIRHLGRPRRHYHKIIVCTDSKGGGGNG